MPFFPACEALRMVVW